MNEYEIVWLFIGENENKSVLVTKRPLVDDFREKLKVLYEELPETCKEKYGNIDKIKIVEWKERKVFRFGIP